MILLSGGTGFIGKAICKELDNQGLEHYVLTRQPKQKNHIQFDIFNFTESELSVFAERKISFIHCAWYVNHKDYQSSNQNQKWHSASVNLVRLLSEYQLEHVTALGSCLEYADNEKIKTNTSALSAHNQYSASKIATQSDMRSLLKNKNIPFCWARIFYVYGKGEKKGRLVPLILNAKRKKEILLINNANAVIDLRHVEDVAKDVVYLSSQKKDGEFNVSSGRGQTVQQIVKNFTTTEEYQNYYAFEETRNNGLSVGINNVYSDN